MQFVYFVDEDTSQINFSWKYMKRGNKNTDFEKKTTHERT